jgi:anti-sigma regulatory factor (Ser/Thr protein kinase)
VGQTRTIGQPLDFSIAATAAAPAGARVEIGAWLARERSDEVLIETAQLVVSELVTNSVRHAQTAAGARVRLTASLQGSMLHIELFDTGVDGNVSRRPPTFEDGSGGFGLDLVAELATTWGVERGPRGTTVWLDLPLHGVR